MREVGSMLSRSAIIAASPRTPEKYPPPTTRVPMAEQPAHDRAHTQISKRRMYMAGAARAYCSYLSFSAWSSGILSQELIWAHDKNLQTMRFAEILHRQHPANASTSPSVQFRALGPGRSRLRFLRLLLLESAPRPTCVEIFTEGNEANEASNPDLLLTTGPLASSPIKNSRWSCSGGL